MARLQEGKIILGIVSIQCSLSDGTENQAGIDLSLNSTLKFNLLAAVPVDLTEYWCREEQTHLVLLCTLVQCLNLDLVLLLIGSIHYI